MQKNELLYIVDSFDGLDRFNYKKNLPKGFQHVKKEIFANHKYLIKYSNYNRNEGVDHYAFHNESFWLQKFQNYSFIPRFFGKVKKNHNIYLFMEYINGSSLDNLTFKDWFYVKKNINILEMKLQNILNIFKQENVIHRDLRPHNIIIKINNNQSFTIMVVDFQYMINFGQNMNYPNKSKSHYSKVLENIGGDWRCKELDLNSFENDSYAIKKIISDLKNESFSAFILNKIKGYKIESIRRVHHLAIWRRCRSKDYR